MGNHCPANADAPHKAVGMLNICSTLSIKLSPTRHRGGIFGCCSNMRQCRCPLPSERRLDFTGKRITLIGDGVRADLLLVGTNDHRLSKCSTSSPLMRTRRAGVMVLPTTP